MTEAVHMSGRVEATVCPSPSSSGEALDEALGAELATAETLLDVDQLRALVILYDRLGMEDEALALINRIMRFKIDSRGLLPFMLDSLIRQRSLAKLNQAARLVQGLPDRPPALRRPLARALALLGQVKPAADEWRAILKEDAMEDQDWLHLATFLAEHGDINALGNNLIANSESFRDHAQQPLALFCILRSQIDQDLCKARETLEKIPADGIDDGDLSFELAILAFRLGAFAHAEVAARHALKLKPDCPAAENALLTFQTFAGKGVEALKPLRLRHGVTEAVQGASEGTPLDEYAWGALYDLGEGSIIANEEAFESSGERGFDLPDTDVAIATFSVLPETEEGANGHVPVHSDPLEVLSFIDWSVPHLMLQRESGQTTLHAFLGASGHREWYWQEVCLELSCADTGHREDQSEGGHVWAAVLDELESREREEML